jgi:hypothetical protein
MPNFSKVFRPLLSIPVLVGYLGPPKGLRGHTIYSGLSFEGGKGFFLLEARHAR